MQLSPECHALQATHIHTRCPHHWNYFQFERLKINPKGTAALNKPNPRVTDEIKQVNVCFPQPQTPLTAILVLHTWASPASHTHTNRFTCLILSKSLFRLLFTHSSSPLSVCVSCGSWRTIDDEWEEPCRLCESDGSVFIVAAHSLHHQVLHIGWHGEQHSAKVVLRCLKHI